MSTSLNEYQKKRALLEQLEREVREIEKDPQFSEQLRFIEAIDTVLAEYNKPRDALVALLPPRTREQLESGKAGKAAAPGGQRNRRPSTLKIFEHPETGERVEAKSLANQTLRHWVDKHGKATVQSWVIEERETA